MKICKLTDGRPTEIRELPGAYKNISTGGRFLPEMAADGWLIYVPDGSGADIKAYHWETVGAEAIQVVDSTWSVEERQKQAEDEAAAVAAAEAQVQKDRIAGLAAAYGQAVTALAGYLALVGWSIPCDSSLVMADLIARAAADTLDEKQRDAKSNVADLYLLLRGAGVTNADIAAIWEVVKPE
jgi:hypothetical protein